MITMIYLYNGKDIRTLNDEEKEECRKELQKPEYYGLLDVYDVIKNLREKAVTL